MDGKYHSDTNTYLNLHLNSPVVLDLRTCVIFLLLYRYWQLSTLFYSTHIQINSSISMNSTKV